jgi:hypothetical protein
MDVVEGEPGDVQSQCGEQKNIGVFHIFSPSLSKASAI